MAKKKQKIVVFDIVYDKKKKCWKAKVRKSQPEYHAHFYETKSTSDFTKREYIRSFVKLVKDQINEFSIRIHYMNGKFQEERTYPRSADPRKSKG